MNNKRRQALTEIKRTLTIASDKIGCLLEQEEDALDNYPENLQDSDNYERIESAVSNLEDAVEHIENAIDSISAAQE